MSAGQSNVESQPVPSPIISVVIGTHNQAELLERNLYALCNQTLSKSEYEVIVVDNNSADRTSAVAESFCGRFSNVRYCFEPRQGVSHARNLGLRLARGKYVGFSDDDCEVRKEWLSIACEIIEQLSPAVFGGGYLAGYNSRRPRWYKHSYGTSTFGETAKILKPEVLYGGNIFYKRSLLVKLGGFNTTMGHVGKMLGYGEDAEPQLLMRNQMPDEIIYYDPRLNVYHLVRPEKMSLRWIARQRYRMGHDNYRLFSQFKPSPAVPRELRAQFIMTVLRLLFDLTLGAVRRDREKYPYFQNYFYEHTSEHLASLGRVCAKYRRVTDKMCSVM